MYYAPKTPTVIAAALVAAFSWTVLVPPANGDNQLDFPSPLSGPGVVTVKKSQKRKIQRGWEELVAGDLLESRKRAARAGQVPPARLLGYQILLTEGQIDVTAELRTFCGQYPGYAAGWMTLSVAAERTGSELIALEAARQGSHLWTTPPWGDRATDLEQRWVDDRIVQARRLFDAESSGAALAELDAADALNPDRQNSTLLRAEILFSNGQLAEAESLLEEISGVPDAELLRGQIAENRGNWKSAMDSYSSLPDDYPGRALALERAQIRWRLNLLPGYARASMAAEQLTRGDLAVVLVSVQPRLETLPGGTVPVMSDIVDHPGQREIITVVRLGIMKADRRGHLFYPNGPADAETVREALQLSMVLLGLPAPVWCGEPDMVGSACTSIPSSPSGGTIVNVVLDPRSGVGP